MTGTASQGAPPPSYLVWAILSVLCCWPLAIVSIVFATQVNGKWAIGDVAGAQVASECARKFAIWSLIAWGIVLVLWLLVRLGLAMSTGFGN